MNRRNTIRAIGATLTLAAAVCLATTGCGETRWCEHDDTDTRVTASYCASGTPGYEWEPDHDDHKTKPTTKKPASTTKKAPR